MNMQKCTLKIKTSIPHRANAKVAKDDTNAHRHYKFGYCIP